MSDVAAVLTRAADLVETDGTSALKAITRATDEVAGPGVSSVELHMAALDAVCLDVFGRRHGYDCSVSRWERRAESAGDVVAALRRLAEAA